MPLPSGITSDPDPSVSEDEDGNMMVLTSDGLAATFKDGRWQPGRLFSSLSWMNDFWRVSDQHKKDRILSAAADALREFKRMEAERSSKESEQSTSDASLMPKGYHITVFDNFHHGECWLGAGFPTAEEAVASVKKTVDSDLKQYWAQLSEKRSKIRRSTPDDLISYYNSFAETPVAFDDKGGKIFDTIAYMEARAFEIVGDAPSGSSEWIGGRDLDHRLVRHVDADFRPDPESEPSRPLDTRCHEIMKLLIVVRLSFASLIGGIAILAYPFFLFVCEFTAVEHECQSEQPLSWVLGAILVLFLPAVGVLIAGWWRSEISIKGIVANQEYPLSQFRLAMAIVLVLSLFTFLSGIRAIGGTALLLLPAAVVAWVVVEVATALAKKIRRNPHKSK